MIGVVSSLILRVGAVNRSQEPRKMLEDTGYIIFGNKYVVESMPKGCGEEVEVVFFKLGRYISDDILEKEYELLSLKPCDPYSLIAVNRADHSFVHRLPNGTHWKDAKGRWCCAKLHVRSDEPYIRVELCRHRDWYPLWSFAGIRK